MLRIDMEDLKRHNQGVLIQDAFADHRGRPYLSRQSLVYYLILWSTFTPLQWSGFTPPLTPLSGCSWPLL